MPITLREFINFYVKTMANKLKISNFDRIDEVQFCLFCFVVNRNECNQRD